MSNDVNINVNDITLLSLNIKFLCMNLDKFQLFLNTSNYDATRLHS